MVRIPIAAGKFDAVILCSGRDLCISSCPGALLRAALRVTRTRLIALSTLANETLHEATATLRLADVYCEPFSREGVRGRVFLFRLGKAASEFLDRSLVIWPGTGFPKLFTDVIGQDGVVDASPIALAANQRPKETIGD